MNCSALDSPQCEIVPYRIQLHRQHLERQARLRAAASPARIIRDPAIVRSTEILVYPAHVFANDCDRAPRGQISSGGRVREIQELICRNLKLARADLLSARRDRFTVMARQAAMYLCKIHTPNSLPDLGRRFGGRDHTTILSAVRRVEATMASPKGTSVSPQWSVDACDLMRDVVNLAAITISTWGNDRTARARFPSRSGK